MINCFYSVQTIGTTDHFLQAAEAKLRHPFTQILGNKGHKVHDMLRIAGEVFAKLRILRCNTNRASIKLTYAHHDAAYSYKRRCREAVLLRSKQRCHCKVASGKHFTVRLNNDPVTQIVQHECLVRLCKSKLPWKPGVPDRALRRCACSAVITANQNNVCTTFSYTCRNRAYPCLRYKLHIDSGARVCIFQVKNQLSQILDGINIMMRRR
ncbi:hypothetical protein D3C78_1282990 [compost metagenome]